MLSSGTHQDRSAELAFEKGEFSGLGFRVYDVMASMFSMCADSSGSRTFCLKSLERGMVLWPKSRFGRTHML